MALLQDLESEVANVFRDAWATTAGRVVPVPSSVGLGNKAIEFDSAVVLYADLDGSTTMVDTKAWQFSAEIYKTYLHCAAKIIKAQGGTSLPMTVPPLRCRSWWTASRPILTAGKAASSTCSPNPN